MICQLKVRPENVAEFEALMGHVVAMTREHEPGVIHYAFAKSVDESDTYAVVEVYRDAEVHAAHMATPWVTEALPKSAALIEGLPHIRQYVCEGSRPVRRTIASD
jgi:quinol monooxygenase YgiN